LSVAAVDSESCSGRSSGVRGASCCDAVMGCGMVSGRLKAGEAGMEVAMFPIARGIAELRLPALVWAVHSPSTSKAGMQAI